MPDEKKSVQINAKDSLLNIVSIIENAYNIIGAQDKANCKAIVDVKDDEGNVIMKQVPVTHLLFLEKQIKDLNTVVNSLPILDSAEDWEYSKEQNCFKTGVEESLRTKKILKAFVKYEATDKHPAQVDTYTEDVSVGTWKKIKYSGAMQKKDKDIILEKIRKLDKAIKLAREEANMIEVEKVAYGSDLVKYLFN
jgi:hypothetical protein